MMAIKNGHGDDDVDVDDNVYGDVVAVAGGSDDN